MSGAGPTLRQTSELYQRLFWLVGLMLGAMLSACASDGAADRASTVVDAQSASHWADASLPEIAQAIDRGAVTSVALVQEYLRRIDSIDRAGPTLRSVLAINPDALDRARELDAMRSQGKSAGPLHGVPVLLKDNIEASGKLPTTAGSTALVGNVTGRDSPLVAGLRNAGAIVLGKTNLSQWANFRSSASMSGWSSLGGQVRNPHVLDRNPCGSSSGSGVAVAAGLAAGAVGTETNGSIICPSTVNGVVGFKPTVGLLSADYIVPVSFTQDTAGPMARSVRGAALMLDAMTHQSTQRPFSSALDRASLSGVRLGVLRYSVGDHPGIKARFAEALTVLSQAGATLIEIQTRQPRPAGAQAMARMILDVEFKHGLNAYLQNSPADIPVRSLDELIAYNRSAAELEMVLFGQDIFIQSAATKGLDDPGYRSAVKTMTQSTRAEGIDALLDKHNLDALLFPSGPIASAIDAINGDVWPSWVGDGAAAAVAGYPHITVPMGMVRGLPIGLSFVASKDQDAKVLQLGYAFEQATKLRVAPQFLPTAVKLPVLERATSPVEEWGQSKVPE